MEYLLEKKRSALPTPKKKRRIGLRRRSVESCEGDHCISSIEEEVCPSNPKNERSSTMASFLLSHVESCGGNHVLLEKRRLALPTLSRREG